MYDFFKLVLFRPVVKFLFGAKLSGEQNIPATGGAVLAVNHIGAFETYALPALMRLVPRCSVRQRQRCLG